MNKRVTLLPVIFACAVLAALVIVGIGCGSGTAATITSVTPAQSTTTAAAATTTAAAVAPTTSTTAPTATTTTATSGEETTATQPSATQAPTGYAWATIVTLRSTDSLWQGLQNVRVSKPFTLTGEARLVLDMPDAGEFDGVIFIIIPADKATDFTALLDALPNGVVSVLVKNAPIKAISGLHGTFVLVNSVPGSKPWSVELQTPA
jgi:hypothetical protein